jgi:hypothetical protein
VKLRFRKWLLPDWWDKYEYNSSNCIGLVSCYVTRYPLEELANDVNKESHEDNELG